MEKLFPRLRGNLCLLRPCKQSFVTRAIWHMTCYGEYAIFSAAAEWKPGGAHKVKGIS
jgi:hypothetical protein